MRQLPTTACPAPDLAGHTRVWTGTLNMGAIEAPPLYGYIRQENRATIYGSLSDTTFEVDTSTYTIEDGYLSPTAFNLNLTRRLAPQHRARLVLHVCDEAFEFGDAVGCLSYAWPTPGLDWTTGTTRTLHLSLRPISTDATLSALSIANGATAIDLNETFAAAAKSYTANVANSVDEITIRPTVSYDGAEYEILDGSGTALTDAGRAPGFQVTLAVGLNVIKVKVTAEDGITTDEYTVRVARVAPGVFTDADLPPDPLVKPGPEGHVCIVDPAEHEIRGFVRFAGIVHRHRDRHSPLEPFGQHVRVSGACHVRDSPVGQRPGVPFGEWVRVAGPRFAHSRSFGEGYDVLARADVAHRRGLVRLQLRLCLARESRELRPAVHVHSCPS